jgi:hypothetical protein
VGSNEESLYLAEQLLDHEVIQDSGYSVGHEEYLDMDYTHQQFLESDE